MKATIWLVVNAKGVTGMLKRYPNLAPGERAIGLTINVPDEAFLDPPTLDAQLDVPASALSYPQPSAAVAVEIWNTKP